jgi:hypothetical protein
VTKQKFLNAANPFSVAEEKQGGVEELTFNDERLSWSSAASRRFTTAVHASLRLP